MSRKKFSSILSLGAFVLSNAFSACDKPEQTRLDQFAQCLTEKKAVMYGITECGACDAQKILFGDSFKYVTYIDCDKERLLCSENEIEAYPTWGNGKEKYVGVQTLDVLAKLYGCDL